MTVEMVQAVLVLGREFPDASAREIRDAVLAGRLERRVVGPRSEALVDFARAHLEAALG